MADRGAVIEALACRNCGAPVPENFCSRCGQHRDAGVVSLRSMASEFVEDQLTLGAALPRTLGALLFRPGRLTREYVEGRVVRYVRPFRLFLVATILFFVGAAYRVDPLMERLVAENAPRVQLVEGEDPRWNNVGIGLEPEDVPVWLRPVLARVQDRAERLNRLPPREYLRLQIGATFEAATRATFLLVPVFALLLLVLHWRRKRLYAEHFVFALHFHAAAFLTVTVGLLVGHPLLWAAIGLYLLVYLFLALRTAYAQPGWRAGLKMVAILLVYATAIFAAAIGAMIVSFFLV